MVGVRCLRADEIERSGRITEQIYEAIANADALVADIGGLDPNVMYELGYAHALKKEVIILNDRDDAPFDIKEFRWIRYEVDDISEPKAKLARFLQNTLRLDGEP
jgi:nucleoside 2-deoxyribosyltransferase